MQRPSTEAAPRRSSTCLPLSLTCTHTLTHSPATTPPPPPPPAPPHLARALAAHAARHRLAPAVGDVAALAKPAVAQHAARAAGGRGEVEGLDLLVGGQVKVLGPVLPSAGGRPACRLSRGTCSPPSSPAAVQAVVRARWRTHKGRAGGLQGPSPQKQTHHHHHRKRTHHAQSSSSARAGPATPARRCRPAGATPPAAPSPSPWPAIAVASARGSPGAYRALARCAAQRGQQAGSSRWALRGLSGAGLARCAARQLGQ